MFNRFLTNWTNTPAIGPMQRSLLEQVTSEMSNFKNVGVNHNGKSNNININAITDKTEILPWS